MRRRAARPAWMPTPVQELLLKAILGPEEKRTAAWEHWQATADVNNLDAGSHRLLPLLWQSLVERGAEHPEMATLKGVYRRAWYQNQMHFHQAGELLKALHAAGIETMVLKGAALTLLHYRNVGLRPMDDLDIAVRRAQAAQAVDLLFASGWIAEVTPLKGFEAPTYFAKFGWTPKRRRREAFTGAYFDVRHAHGFVSPQNTRVDLHWRVLQEEYTAEVDEVFWQDGIPLELGGAATRALGPADQLLHACAHAARWNPVPPVRWVADAEAVLRSTGSALDWERLVGQAQNLALTLPLTEMLGYLVERFGLPVPTAAIEALRRGPIKRGARLAYRIRVGRPGFRTGWEELRYLRRRHRTLKEAPDTRCAVGNLPSFVSDMIGADGFCHLALYVAFESARRVFGR